MFDTDKAAVRNSRMWEKMGHLLKARAFYCAEKGWADDALKNARAADFCHWQATGEGDSFSAEQVFGKEKVTP